MLKKYDIKDLYLAKINVQFPKYRLYNGAIVDVSPDIDGGMLIGGAVGYSYTTVVLKKGDKLIDLFNKKARLNEISPLSDSFIIESLEPLANYYNKSNVKKLGKKKALEIATKKSK